MPKACNWQPPTNPRQKTSLETREKTTWEWHIPEQPGPEEEPEKCNQFQGLCQWPLQQAIHFTSHFNPSLYQKSPWVGTDIKVLLAPRPTRQCGTGPGDWEFLLLPHSDPCYCSRQGLWAPVLHYVSFSIFGSTLGKNFPHLKSHYPQVSSSYIFFLSPFFTLRKNVHSGWSRETQKNSPEVLVPAVSGKLCPFQVTCGSF